MMAQDEIEPFALLIRQKSPPFLMGQTLEIEVRELTPELLQDYLRFFDQAFSDFPHWAGCYCGFYDTPGNDWDATAKAGPQHRAARSQQIGSGKAQGQLAYIDGTPIGWCNAQPRANFANMRHYTVAGKKAHQPVSALNCFLIPPRHQREGDCTPLPHTPRNKIPPGALQIEKGD